MKEEELQNYKALYEERKCQLDVQEEKHEIHVLNLQLQYEKETHEHQLLQEKYDALEKVSKDHFKDMKTYYESAIVEKDKQIVSQRKTIEKYDERLCMLISKESNKGVTCSRSKTALMKISA